MAEIPSNGDTDWGTKMNAYQAIGHDTDGTHKKPQMLTDMEWSPTTYAGGESVTFPNGLIIKSGFKATDGETSVTYGLEFPGGVVSVVIVDQDTAGSTGSANTAVRTSSTTGFTCFVNTVNDGFYWMAIGY